MIDATEHQEFLISEVLRFYEQHDRSPQPCEMNGDNGYPTKYEFLRHFEHWGELLFTAAHENLKNKAWERYKGS